MRKLLPYEHQLVEALGISEKEYLEFVAVQQEYKDPKIGTALDTRAEITSTTAVVLTIIGVLFQVGAALLAPKPEIPDVGSRKRNREQRFAPTFGFNSTQELASYGDPVNLVYTNQNSSGNVRVAGSLVWSAIENFGSTQFMQLLLVLGASKIQSIDYTKTAFGQAALVDLDKQSVFVFAKSDGTEGRPDFGDIQAGFGTKDLYPKRLKPVDAKPAFQIVTHNEKKFGFSQAYTPSTSTSLGVFDAIPINVDVITRNKKGKEKEANIAIELRNVAGTANSKWRTRSGSFAAGDTIQLFFNNAGHKNEGDDKDSAKAADDMRRQMVEGLDFGSTYMLGSAKFRLEQVVSDAKNIDEGEVRVNLTCIELGQLPGSPYERTTPKTEDLTLKEEMENAQAILSDTRTIESETEEEKPICVYTDGACTNNGKKNAKAGFGVYFGKDDPRNVSESYNGPQTNNVAELLAIIKALSILREEIESGQNIVIYSDSTYSIRCCTDYGEKMEKKNWMKKKRSRNSKCKNCKSCL